MEPKKIDLLKQRALSFKETTQKWSEKTKQEYVSYHLADSFNHLVQEIVKMFPHLKRPPHQNLWVNSGSGSAPSR